MIVELQTISLKYLNKAYKEDKKRHEIYTRVLKVKQKLHFDNEKKEQIVSLF